VLDSLTDVGTLEATVHARAGVNCSGCHGNWSQAVSLEVCGECHQRELSGFQTGRHGMRTKLGLEPMLVAVSVLSMNVDAHARVLECTSCHGSHDFDTKRAASEACQGCHADEHTRSYAASPHAELWRRELSSELAPGRGVSCATCHLPRMAGEQGAFVEHNQNDNLRPSEKMVRDVCLRCHGLGFTLNSLADAELVRANFTGHPKVDVASIALVARRQANSRSEGPAVP
jgi:mono/diheme cytochrome c family protein